MAGQCDEMLWLVGEERDALLYLYSGLPMEQAQHLFSQEHPVFGGEKYHDEIIGPYG